MKSVCILLFLNFFLYVALANQAMSPCTQGRMTYYDYTGGHCSFGSLTGPTGPGYVYVAAPNTKFYDGSKQCGVCYEVTSSKGTVRIMIADECPVSGNEQWCSGDVPHFDLSREAYTVAGTLSNGVEPMTYRMVSCDVSGNIGLHFKDGSSIYWFGIMVFNHRVGVSSVEVQPSGSSTWTTLARQTYNYFLWTSGTMTLPMKVRVTGFTGEQVVTTVNSIPDNQVVSTSVQFQEPAAGWTGGNPSAGCGTSGSTTASATTAPATTARPTTGPATTGPVTTGPATTGPATTGPATTGPSSTSGGGSPAGGSVSFVYSDSLKNGWQNWSWGSTNAFAATGAYDGASCIRSALEAWGGLQFGRNVAVPSASFLGVSFWAKTSSGNYENLVVSVNDGTPIAVAGITSTWKYFYVDMSKFGNPSTVAKLAFQNHQSTGSTLYFDNIQFIYNGAGDPFEGLPETNSTETTDGSDDDNGGSGALAAAVSLFCLVVGVTFAVMI